MRKSIIGLVILSCLAACHPDGRVYVEHQELSPDVEWLRTDKREFDVPIEDTNQKYNLSLSFRYANGYPYEYAHIKVTEISPEGVQVVRDHKLIIRDKNGDYLGDPGFDIWDSEHIIEKDKTYTEKGIHKYIVEHNMSNDPMNFAMEVGIILDEVK